MSTLEKMLLKSKLPPRGPSGVLTPRGSGGNRRNSGKRDYSPVQWNKYYEGCQDVKCGNNTFRVYTAGTVGPVLVLLHGGGFSALTWSLFSASITGMVQCRILALDLRGHGDSVTVDDDDLSAETMAGDIGAIISSLYDFEPPPIILIGHSMGGAIAVHTALGNHIPSLIGLAVIDVVEGTALDALTSMQSFLRSRPKQFKSLENAIEWCVRSGQVRNVDSARVSMPGQIKNTKTGKLATNDVATFVANTVESSDRLPTISNEFRSESITEDDETADCETSETPSEETPVFTTPHEPDQTYTWRIDLGQTEKYWPGWFKGLSSAFLNCPVPKMLLLAGIDRLDKDLTVGQMQGKFQMQVLPACGHAVHEDVPDKVAEALATFMVRNKFAEPVADFHRIFPAC